MKHRNTGNMDRIISFVNNFFRDNHKTPSARQISHGTGIPRTTLQRMMRTMAEKGLIDYDGETVVTDLSVKASEETTSVGIIGAMFVLLLPEPLFKNECTFLRRCCIC